MMSLALRLLFVVGIVAAQYEVYSCPNSVITLVQDCDNQNRYNPTTDRCQWLSSRKDCLTLYYQVCTGQMQQQVGQFLGIAYGQLQNEC